MTKYEYNEEMINLVTKRARLDSSVTKEIFLAAIEGFEKRLYEMSVEEAEKPITEQEQGFIETYRKLVKEYEGIRG